MFSFMGQSGRTWTVDPDRRLGGPSGFGEVFVGTDGSSEWAIKRVTLRQAGNTDELRLRAREVEMARKLSAAGSPLDHVLFPIDWGMAGDDLLMVMPKAARSLDVAIAAGELDRAAQHAVLRDIATGLVELASVGVMHRDLKPGNVLWLDGRWRLSDFGISRDLDTATATSTFKGFGSMAYLAPEVWAGRPATVRSDLYAFGVLAYELVTGRRPFPGPNSDDYQRQHMQDPPPPLQINDGRLERLITRLLSKDPAGRPQDARAVQETLEAAARRLAAPKEELAAAAAQMFGVFAQRDAEKAKRDAIAGMKGQALTELGAFLADAVDDLSDVFPGASCTDLGGGDDLIGMGYGSYGAMAAGRQGWHIDLGVVHLWITPIDPAGWSSQRDVTTSVVHSCVISAAVEDAFAGGDSWSTRMDLPSVANLICDLVDDRLVWAIALLTSTMYFPNGNANTDLYALRESTAKGYASGHFCLTLPLNQDTMARLIRHTFMSLSGEQFGASPLMPNWKA